MDIISRDEKTEISLLPSSDVFLLGDCLGILPWDASPSFTTISENMFWSFFPTTSSYPLEGLLYMGYNSILSKSKPFGGVFTYIYSSWFLC